ncbi:MAG TPA: MSMEG_4193 family putative phosphomutase [Marmoricola sp.]|nr:MSMEG_4193 family putative phosphomutase [Marmoricola sp.]HNJ78710.1 MSMEG_4193 family putative phosphomutase [Marmoricola sp.]
MTTLILARHGRTAANAAGILAGRSGGVGIDEAGIQQARKAANRLLGESVVRVVSSPMQRCLETAEIICPAPVAEVEPGLDECDYGDWTGSTLAQLTKENLWRTVQVQPSLAHFPNGESIPQMAGRAVQAVRRINAEVAALHGDDAVWLAVTHGDVIKAILNDALGAHLDAFQRIVVNPASLSVIRYTAERPYVLAMNTNAGPLPLRKQDAGSPHQTDQAAVGGGI